MALIRKIIYRLPALARVYLAVNRWYLAYISCLDHPTPGSRDLSRVTRQVTQENRPYQVLNFFGQVDLCLIQILTRGEFNLTGLRNQALRPYLLWSRGKVSRLLKPLRVHVLISQRLAPTSAI